MLGTKGSLPVKPTERGIAHLLLATRYSYRGLRSAWRYEESFRQEALVILVSVPLAMWLARDIIDFLLLTLPVLLTLAAELGNSAIEAVVDRTFTHVFGNLSIPFRNNNSNVQLLSTRNGRLVVC